MMTIASLFGRSPFSPLTSHMEKVATCVHQLPPLFEALKNQDMVMLNTIASEIENLEHQADETKKQIRNDLPRSLFLAINRETLLEILSLQDKIADKAEDVAVLLTLKPLIIPPSFITIFDTFLAKNLEAFEEVFSLMKELHGLMEASFGGMEAKKVALAADKVAFKEHEVDLIQRNLFKVFIQEEKEMNITTFYLWQKIIDTIASISNLSENLADRMRTTLEIK